MFPLSLRSALSTLEEVADRPRCNTGCSRQHGYLTTFPFLPRLNIEKPLPLSLFRRSSLSSFSTPTTENRIDSCDLTPSFSFSSSPPYVHFFLPFSPSFQYQSKCVMSLSFLFCSLSILVRRREHLSRCLSFEAHSRAVKN